MKKLQANVSLVVVTPEMASEWLSSKWGEQRNLRGTHVEKLREDMATGQFRLSPDALLLVQGKLANGQHRLSAVVAHGKPIPFLLMESNDPELYKVVDAGLKRQAADGLVGIHFAQHLPPIASWVMAYDLEKLSRTRVRPCTQATMIDYCVANKDILQEAAEFASRLYSNTRLLPISMGGALYVMSKKIGEEAKVKLFLEGVYLGSGNGSAGPAHELRNKLITNMGSKAKLSPGYLFGLCIKALRAYLRGEKVAVLKWADGEEMPKL